MNGEPICPERGTTRAHTCSCTLEPQHTGLHRCACGAAWYVARPTDTGGGRPAMAYEYITRYTSPNYTPKDKVPSVYGSPRRIEGITIHHWGIDGQKFQNVVNYLCRKGGSTSAHYVVEAGKVACIVDPENAAWHAGNARGNRTTIGIELRPEATDADYQTAAELIAELRATYGDLWLKPHKAWKATSCPGRWNLARLDVLARGVKGGGAGTSPVITTPDPAPKPTPAPKPAPAGPRSGKVPGTGITVTADGDFGRYTKTAYQQVLHNLGYRGHAVDGDFGPASTRSEQQWLRDRGQRGHAVDGQRGPYTIRSLQAHLHALGYRGHAVDGDFGPYTVTSLQLALIDGKVK